MPVSNHSDIWLDTLGVFPKLNTIKRSWHRYSKKHGILLSSEIWPGITSVPDNACDSCQNFIIHLVQNLLSFCLLLYKFTRRGLIIELCKGLFRTRQFKPHRHFGPYIACICPFLWLHLLQQCSDLILIDGDISSVLSEFICSRGNFFMSKYCEGAKSNSLWWITGFNFTQGGLCRRGKKEARKVFHVCNYV